MITRTRCDPRNQVRISPLDVMIQMQDRTDGLRVEGRVNDTSQRIQGKRVSLPDLAKGDPIGPNALFIKQGAKGTGFNRSLPDVGDVRDLKHDDWPGGRIDVGR